MKSLSLLLVPSALAWQFPQLQVAFNPQDTPGQHRLTLQDHDKIDIVTGSQFSGLKTFASLPYVNCFSDKEAKGKNYDIVILGAPFDTVSSLLEPEEGVRLGTRLTGSE
jgi:agmatinase